MRSPPIPTAPSALRGRRRAPARSQWRRRTTRSRRRSPRRSRGRRLQGLRKSMMRFPFVSERSGHASLYHTPFGGTNREKKRSAPGYHKRYDRTRSSTETAARSARRRDQRPECGGSLSFGQRESIGASVGACVSIIARISGDFSTARLMTPGACAISIVFSA